MTQPLNTYTFDRGYASQLAESNANGYMATGSKNVMVYGVNSVRPFRGLTEVPGINASRLNFLVDNSYAGLGSYGDPGRFGRGTIFKAKDLLLYIGNGKLKVRGVDTTRLASATLSYIKRNGGNFDNTSTIGQIGHAAPPKPEVYVKTPPSSGKKAMNASVTIAIWRVDSLTGQVSNKSQSSDVIEIANGSAIVVFPEKDDNNQDYWGVGGSRLGLADLGNIYELPTEIGGEVAEADLIYTRATAANGTILNGSNLLENGDNDFTNNDIGRRIYIGVFTSWIVSVNNSGEAVLYDINDGADISAIIVINHAIDGHERSVEVSWSDDDFLGQNLAPTDAFPPPSGSFAIAMFDIVVLEDQEGSIFYSIPDYLGSFPRSRRILTDDQGIAYISESEGVIWRIGRQSVSMITYVAGDVPIQYEVKVKGHGCKFSTNAAFGYAGDVLFFSGTPIRIVGGETVDTEFYQIVEAEFAIWASAQSEDSPVVPAYDPRGKYEIWCFNKTIMAYHPPTNRWCAPISIAPYVSELSKIVGQVIIEDILHLIVDDGSTLKAYQFDAGAGSTMTVTSTNMNILAESANINRYKALLKIDNDLTTGYTFYIIKDDNIASPIQVGAFSPTGTNPSIQKPEFRPNIRGCKQIGVRMVATDADPNLELKSISIEGDLIGVKQ